ncbi:DUF1508 domain-containing protein [Verrucomicrobia bacterium LW23]|nr:DUF1508 domain-containing protein [Verrucomicrobia bacterium LW23]
MKIAIKKGKNGQFYFNVVAANHKVLATSEMYINKGDAKSAAEAIKKASFEVADETEEK